MSTPITKFVRVSTRLASKVIPAATFGNGLFLGCIEDGTDYPIGEVPVDQRYLMVTKDDFADYLDADGEAYAYALAYFAQDYTPDALYIGRTIQDDSRQYTILSGGALDYVAFELVTTGYVKFTDDAETPHTVQVGPVSFDGITSRAQILTKLNLAMAALVAPAITHLENGRFAFDTLDRLVFYMPDNTGADAPIVSFVAATLGTDLFADAYLGHTQTTVAGVDAETLVQSFNALEDLALPVYNVTTYTDHGDTTISDTEYLALASYIETRVYQLDICTEDPITKAVDASASLAYKIHALALDRTTVYYTERTGQRPDGANAGFVFPQAAGSCSFAYNPLSGVSESGADGAPLTAAQMTRLDTLHVMYVCRVADVVFVFKSLTTSGEEKRIILGIDWFNVTCQTDIINDRLVKKIHAYDYATFGAIESILRKNAKIAADRNIIYAVDDKDYPFTVDMPDPTDFSAAEKKTHIFDREVFHAFIKSEILNWEISGTFEI